MNPRLPNARAWPGRLLLATAGVSSAAALAAAEPTSPSASGKTAPDISELPIEALMEIEVPTVYAASKVEQKTTEAPSSVSVVSADEIRRFGYHTLADVLQSLHGFHVSYDRNYAFLGTRGINLGDFNGRVLLLVNGHRANNNLTDGAFIDTAFLLDVDLIDRVEVIRGPGSVLYGNNAFFGVINVVTKRGRQIDGVEISGEYGDFDTYKARVTLGHAFTNGIDLLLSGSFYDSDGAPRLYYPEFNTPEENRGVARGRDDDQFGSFFGSLSYYSFTLEGGYIQREKGNPTAQFGTTFNDPRLRTIDERSYTAVKFTHSFPELVDVNARVYYDRSDFEIGYPLVLRTPGNVEDLTSREQDFGEWWGAELQLSRRFYDRHIATIGAEYRDDFRQERQLTGQPTVRSDRESHGIYGQADAELHKQLHLHGGVRYDRYGDFDAEFSPRVALIYNPVEKSTVKAIYGTAFRVPNFLELTLARPSGELAPEEITSYELVFEQEIVKHLRGSVSVYHNEMEGLIAFQNGGFVNFDAETHGMELALEGSWPKSVRGRVSYSLQESDAESVGYDLPDSPEHLFKASVSVPVWREKIFAGVEFQYTSQRESLRSATTDTGDLLTVQGRTTGGFGVVNLTLYSRELVKDLEFSASIYNVLDHHYSDPATRFHRQETLERDGRTYRLKVTYRF
jgi:outer membrane receptor for ferrienterochelin and colicins